MTAASSPLFKRFVSIKLAFRSLLSNLSIRSKLSLAFVGVTVLAVGLISFFGSRVTRDKLLLEVGTNLKTQATVQGLTIGETLDHQVLLLQAFSLDSLIQDDTAQADATYSADPATIQASIQSLNAQWLAAQDNDPLVSGRVSNPMSIDLREYLAVYPANVDLLVTDKYGVVVAASRRPSQLFQGNEDWWKVAWNDGRGNFYIGQPVLDPTNQIAAIKIALPVRDPDSGQPSGVIAVSYGLSELSQYVDSVHIGKTGLLRLLFPDGRILEHSGNSFQQLPAKAVADIQSTTNNFAEMSLQGIPSLVSQAPVTALDPASPLDAVINRLGWRALVNQDSEESFQPLNAAGQIDPAISLGTLLVSLALAFGLTRRFNNRVGRLMEVTQQIAAGDLSRRAAIISRDEISQLAISFNTMADAVQTRTTDLTKLRDSLTVLVEERTAALQNTNETLREEIRERNLAEKARQQSEEHLRQITDNMLDIVCQTDSTGIIEYASRSCLDVLGYHPEALIGRSIFSRVHPDDLERVREAVLNTGTIECRYRHANGQYLWLETLSSLLFSESGTASGIVFASRDITLRKQAQQELQELNQLKTEFLSTAAHELRTPLTSIRGFSELLLMRVVTEERQQRYLQLINEQSTELGRLIDDLLDISRLEAKRSLSLKLAPLNMADLLKKVALPFAEIASNHRLRLEEIADSYPPLVGDAFRLEQVLKNLLSNAVKYSPNGGTVAVRCHVLTDSLEISVQDEGMGMTPEQQTHLFEKFYRADSSNTGILGTGLGLTICKLIVELHGGQIWAESTYGKGTTFYVRLPLAEAALPVEGESQQA